MAVVTVLSDFGAPQKSLSLIASPSVSHEVMGPDAMILYVYLNCGVGEDS